MTQEAEKLYEAAAALPESERAALVMKLLDTLCPADVAASHAEESVARLRALEDGTLNVVDADEAMRLING